MDVYLEDPMSYDEEETFLIDYNRLPKLSKASKDFGLDGKPATDENISEWAFAYAAAAFKAGERIKYSDFADRVKDAHLQQILDDLVNRGFLEVCYDEKEECLKYRSIENFPPKKRRRK